MAGSTWPTLVAGARAKASEVEAKFDWLEGDIVPMANGSKADATYDLGQSSFRFRDGYFSRQVLVPAGSAATPPLSQQGAANGFYFPTTSQIATTNPLLITNGTVGAPSLALGNSPTTGFYRVGANNIALASAGVKSWDVSSVGQITTPLQPAFSSYVSSASYSLTSGQFNTITCAGEFYDVGSNYNNANGLFTAPVSGVYNFIFKYNVSPLTSTAQFTGNLFHKLASSGTATTAYVVRDPGVLTYTVGMILEYCLPTQISMAAGDSVYCSIYLAAGKASLEGSYSFYPSISVTSYATFFSGRLAG